MRLTQSSSSGWSAFRNQSKQKLIFNDILYIFCIFSQLLPGLLAAFTKRGWRNDAHMALRDCNAARELDAYSVPAHQRTSEALLQLKRYKQALQFAERAHQLDPANPGLAELVVLTAGKVREGRFERFLRDGPIVSLAICRTHGKSACNLQNAWQVRLHLLIFLALPLLHLRSRQRSRLLSPFAKGLQEETPSFTGRLLSLFFAFIPSLLTLNSRTRNSRGHLRLEMTGHNSQIAFGEADFFLMFKRG
jgi:tetratricopeptide (TPR) repeat protein